MEKEKFQIEIQINSSKGVLFIYSTPPADCPNGFVMMSTSKRRSHLHLGWQRRKRAVDIQKRDEFAKFRWLEDEEEGINSFFEFRIKIDDLTGDTAWSSQTLQKKTKSTMPRNCGPLKPIA